MGAGFGRNFRILGLSHYKARVYFPTRGRFLQTDPIGYGAGLNWYAYVKNDPVNRADPTGLIDEIVVTDNDNARKMNENLARENLWRSLNGAGPLAASGALPGSQGLQFLDDSLEVYSDATDIQAIGAAGEAHVAAEILASGAIIIGSHVYVRTSTGGLRIVDFLISKNGKMYGIEVKANTARRNFSQRVKDKQIEVFGGTVASRRPLGGGVARGDKVQFHTFEVCVTVGPGC